jgi:protein gp37
VGKTDIEWTDYSINPVKGLCPTACSYCYARRMYLNPFYKNMYEHQEISFDSRVLSEPDKIEKPSKFFVGSTMELFGPWVKTAWMLEILGMVKRNPRHTFIFLTKQPQNLIKWSPFPNNCWVGVSVTNKIMYADALHYSGIFGAAANFISFEPLLSWADIFPRADGEKMLDNMIDWIIIGRQTPISKKTAPKIEWIQEIVDAADSRIPVFIKNNLDSMLPLDNRYYRQIQTAEGPEYVLRQEFPCQVMHAAEAYR